MHLEIPVQAPQLSPVLILDHVSHYLFSPGNELEVTINDGRGGASRNPSEHPALQHLNSGEGQVLFRATAESQNTAVTGHLYPVKQRLIFQNQCYGSTRVLMTTKHRLEINCAEDIPIDNHQRTLIPKIHNIADAATCTQQCLLHPQVHRNGKVRSLNIFYQLFTEMIGIDYHLLCPA